MSSETIFVGDLPAEFDDAQIMTIFGAYGTIASHKLLPVGAYGNRAAIITMGSTEEAAWIVENLNGNIPEGLAAPVKVNFKAESKGKGKDAAGGKAWGGDAWGKGGKDGGDAWGAAAAWGGKDAGGKAAFGAGAAKGGGVEGNTLFIGNLPAAMDDATLQTVFGAYGTVKASKLMEPNSVGFRAAIVEFASVEEAKWIQENLNGNLPEGLTGTDSIMVKFKQGKADGGKGKDAGFGPYGGGKEGGKGKGGKGGKGGCDVKTLVDGLMQSGAMPGGVKYSNDENTLFVGGLPSDTTDLDLFWIFSPFGPIAPKGVKAMMSPDGSCKGFGFVNFLATEATDVAVNTLNGTQMPDGSTLTVTVKKPDGSSKGEGKGEGKATKGFKGGKW